MPGNFKRDDLRILRTRKALIDALTKLMERRSFARLTVNDLCEEAQLSRAAFYSHYKDKYDLLKHWLDYMRPQVLGRNMSYINMEKMVNGYVREHTKVIANLLEDANNETMDLVHSFAFSLFEILAEKRYKATGGPRDIVLSNFCAGGIIQCLLWQVKNKFPFELPMFNPYFFSILECLIIEDKNK